MAERVQQVKGPGARPPRGVKPQVKNPMKIFTRIMKYALKDYTCLLYTSDAADE